MKIMMWLVTGLPLTMCRMNLLQDTENWVLAVLFTTGVSGADFMDVKGYMLSDQSAVRCDPTAINWLLPIA